MRDAPVSDSAYKVAEWTAERVREEEADRRVQDVVQRVVVMIDEATDEVVGLPQMDSYTTYPNRGIRQDTAVVSAHRGHGLGRCVKAHLLRSLLAKLPEINRIFTNVNAGNDHMVRVNRQTGFTTTSTTVAVRAVISDLVDRVTRSE
ncbi:GNAT family N-acetyltransferase [Lentzea sp. NPDC058436]|uniref:GNAT family N-acetyltransferase n=1 Tax=Lentzea sp. NPDC058436 TaxID=3346499 RepID=UPI00365F70E4